MFSTARTRSSLRLAAPGLVVALIGAMVLTGCQSPSPSAQAPGPTSASASPASASPGGFTNPVYDSNFADPMIIAVPGGGYVAVATNGNDSNVQTLTSKNLVDWEPGPDALPKLPKWSQKGKVWAPEVAVRTDGRYVLYYTTRGPNPNIQCISVAVGTKPQGPFVDTSSKPLVCQPNEGGSIDASPFTASDGSRYLYWKNDGNAIGVDTWIYGQRLDSTGTKLLDKPKRLFHQDQAWEGNLVEAPFGWEVDGKIHLFYSANAYDSDAYAVGEAVGSTPLGPFTKRDDPVLVSNDAAAGPGHCALIKADGKVWMAYHAWMPDAIGSDPPGRTLWLSEVTFDAKGSKVVPPTVDYPTAP